MAAERVRMLEEATRWVRHWVLSGAIVAWGDALIQTFDLVVFLSVPAEVRLARLRAREQERFGPEIEPGGSLHEQHQAFLRSAAGYDTGTSGRTLETDANWLAQLNCPVMPITGECSTDDQVDHILSL
jgi:adenylate kinase family enzyme